MNNIHFNITEFALMTYGTLGTLLSGINNNSFKRNCFSYLIYRSLDILNEHNLFQEKQISFSNAPQSRYVEQTKSISTETAFPILHILV